jgi:hypothetical protein
MDVDQQKIQVDAADLFPFSFSFLEKAAAAVASGCYTFSLTGLKSAQLSKPELPKYNCRIATSALVLSVTVAGGAKS